MILFRLHYIVFTINFLRSSSITIYVNLIVIVRFYDAPNR